MISDESSSDSETGRFKGRTKTQEERPSNLRADNPRDSGRSRPSGHERFNRNFDRKREDRDHVDRHSRDRDRDRHRYSRHSPIRRRHSRDRSPRHDRSRHKDLSDKPKTVKEHRSSSRDRHKHSGSASRSHVAHDNRRERDVKEERRHTERAKSPERPVKKSREKSLSPEHKVKRSEIYKPPPTVPVKRRSESPIVIEEHDTDASEEVLPGSYYNMIPAVIKEKSEDSSEIDSSDDERLRAKLLNLEKELIKTKKKKHKKKHKRKSSKSSKDRERDSSMLVEVSSTTDIDLKADVPMDEPEVVEEVTSTQKVAQKDSCEEGEILSDDSLSEMEIDPTDLRHKLRRSTPKADKTAIDVCGPALPPHLEKRFDRSASPDTEGPALPPHLQKKPKNIGPSIPDNMRKTLAEKEREVIKYESSDEDIGIGPLPVGSEEKWSDAHRRLEERALDIKIKNLDGPSESSNVKSREKWMLELPEGKAKILGLEARSFRAKAGPDMSDRSSWTDTPEEKARKAAGLAKEEDIELSLKEEAKMRHIANRDEEQESAVKKHKKKHKREESLLDLHQKKLKKKKKKEEKEDGKKERRPFSRDVDLQVNRFDEAQKKSIIKKAQELNTRFSRGEAKYL
ncbi:RNA-binding protein 25 [Trichoplusia ni]|uniref:RNA-binding protein 25 n=1 Tax=Trichoplusia ni TaxID=7111 RepID=A0A7E5VD80_TRINI|nr:RNA-binding protein 25 [Trichoplusia ni]